MSRTALEDAEIRIRLLDGGVERLASDLRGLMIRTARLRLPLSERMDAHGSRCSRFRAGLVVAMVQGDVYDPVESWELETRAAKLSRSEARAFAHWILHQLETPAHARKDESYEPGE